MNSEISIRCPYCGDSIKNPTKTHFGLNLLKGVFHCFRCGISGRFPKLFKDFPGITENLNLNESKPSKLKNYSFIPTIEIKELRYLQSRRILTALKTTKIEIGKIKELSYPHIAFKGTRLIQARAIENSEKKWFTVPLIDTDLYWDFAEIGRISYNPKQLVLVEGLFDLLRGIELLKPLPRIIATVGATHLNFIIDTTAEITEVVFGFDADISLTSLEGRIMRFLTQNNLLHCSLKQIKYASKVKDLGDCVSPLQIKITEYQM